MVDFNVPPYFDDFDENKGYYKILFRPSVAIQARELNQLQTNLQKQIERMGSHFFKEGTIVTGGAFNYENDVPYVKAPTVSSASRLQEFVGKIVVGGTSGLKAYVKAVELDSDTNNYVFMLRYATASEITTVFLNEEVVSVSDDSTLNFTVAATSATGVGSTFEISTGVVFSRGYFIAFPSDYVILDYYGSAPSATAGILVTESFATEFSDSSLLDNALGSTNENAPGAHRFKILTDLVKFSYKGGYDNPNFIPLIDIRNGVVESKKENTEYERVYRQIAKRTYDESGDYLVNGLGVRTREHLNTGNNEGLISANVGGDSTKLSIDIEPGNAYVKGYGVTKLVTSHIVTDKSIAFDYVNNQKINARTGGYFLIKEIVGSVAHDTGIKVDLYDTAETRISSNIKNTAAVTGNKIGEARVKALVYDSGIMGRSDGTMRAYLFDFNMNAGKTISDIRAIHNNNAPNKFFADVILTNSKAILKETNQNVLLFPLGSSATRTIRSNTGSSDTSFEFNRTESLTANIIASNALSTSVSTVGESISYSDGSLSTSEKRQLILSINTDTDIQLPGTVSVSNNDFAVTGVSTEFDKLAPGDRLLVNGEEYYINTITSNTSLSLSSNVTTGSVVSNVFFKGLRSGDIIDLTANGSSGDTRTATVSSGVLTIDLKENTSNVSVSAINARLTYRVNRTTAVEMDKRLRANRFVKIDTSNNAANSVGPYNLGVADVYKIRSVRMHTSAFSTGTEGSNVTSSFILDNGQRDNFYDHAKIIHTGSLDLSNKYLLVEYDHFEKDSSQGFGYFSVDSYPIDDNTTSNTTIFTYEIPEYISTAGVKYNLRDVLDFRPFKANTSVSTQLISSATINPAATDTLSADTDGLRIVAPDTEINADYSFYLARRDLVTVDSAGKFSIIQGSPAIAPVSPRGNDNVMVLARVYIPPYPSISETLARKINKIDIGCISKKVASQRYTMRQIGNIDRRLTAVEYYNALSLLEKNVNDLLVVDENGLDRFKNGFFVDGFVDHSLGDNSNPDYSIAVDKFENTIRPFFDVDSFKYGIDDPQLPLRNLITFPYIETPFIENINVTTIRNVDQSVFRFIGTIELYPETDNWTDINTVDRNIRFGDDRPISNTIQTEWGSWETNVVGYNVYSTNANNNGIEGNELLGTYPTLAEAQNSAGYNRVFIETLTESERTGSSTVITQNPQTEEIGNFITDASVKTYIRPQTIVVYVKGLKPNTKVYTFFDGENMSEYLTPITIPDTGVPDWLLQNSDVIYDSGNPDLFDSLAEEGSTWRVNENGEAIGLLRLPATGIRFRNGTKMIVVTDSPTNADDATTYSVTYFLATGLSVEKQNTSISTRNTTVTIEDVVENTEESSVSTYQKPIPESSPAVTTPPDPVGGDPTEPDPPLTVVDRVRAALQGPHPPKRTYTWPWEYTPGYSHAWEVYKPPTTQAERRLLTQVQLGIVTEEEAKARLGLSMAYSFKVDVPPDEDGVFLTSVDVWIDQKHPTLGVWFEIREMNNAGGVSRRQVPFSNVWLKNDQVNLWDGTVETEESNKTTVTFPSPVFLQNNTQYAFVIHTEGQNPDYYFWVSRLGDTDIVTGEQVTSRQATGTLFTTNNDLNYDIVPDVDLKVRFNRARFSQGSATLVVGNRPVEFVNLKDGYDLFEKQGEPIRSSEILSLSDTSDGVGNTVIVGDKITGTTSTIVGNVISIDGSKYYTDAFGYTANEAYSVANSTGGSKGITGNFNLVEYGFGKLRYFDSANNLMVIDDSNGIFFSNAQIKGSLTSNTGVIDTFDTFDYSTTTLKPYYITFNKTSTNFEKRGWDVSANAYTEYLPGTPDEYSDFPVECSILSRADEIATFGSSGNNTSAQVRISLSSYSEYVSPVVDIGRFQSITVYNRLNNDITNEDQPSGGNLINKYISKAVTLADGQDAEDLLVKLSVYRPVNSDVKVWMKVKNDEDGEIFSRNNWILMDYNTSVFSSSANKNDFKEIDYTVPANYKDANGVIQYIKNSTAIDGTDAASNSVFVTNADTIFTANQQVYYSVPPGETPIAPLTANTYYYVDTVNSTAITLKETEGGSQISITEFRANTDVQTHTIGGEVYSGYKRYSVKVGLMGTDSAKPPRVGDLRAIALQL